MSDENNHGLYTFMHSGQPANILHWDPITAANNLHHGKYENETCVMIRNTNHHEGMAQFPCHGNMGSHSSSYVYAHALCELEH